MKRSPLILFLFLFIYACFPSRDISTENLASIYRDDNQFHTDYTFFNETDSTTRVYCLINPEEFLYARQPDESFKAEIKIRADVVPSYENVKILDSASAEFSFKIEEKKGMRVVSFILPTKRTGRFIMRMTLIDKTKNASETGFADYERFPISSRFDFIATRNNQVTFKNYLGSDDTISLFFKDSLINEVWCKYYNRDFPLPAPPFSFNVRDDFNYHADSIFKVPVNNGSSIVLDKEGFYHFQTDTSIKTGFTLFRFSPSFPNVSSASQMLESVRYLTNKKEFEEMKKGSPKQSVDNFWLKRGNNNADKTRTLIKKYYTRVQDANKYFSSYTEGWRTDRGMIYVIFGPPNTIYKSESSENWIYGSPNNALSLNVLFIKVDNPFTDNDFTLTRSPLYESHWYRAVDIWRQGRAYNSFY